MLTPVIAERPAQPYLAIRAQVTMQTMDAILPSLQPQVLASQRESQKTCDADSQSPPRGLGQSDTGRRAHGHRRSRCDTRGRKP